MPLVCTRQGQQKTTCLYFGWCIRILTGDFGVGEQEPAAAVDGKLCGERIVKRLDLGLLGDKSNFKDNGESLLCWFLSIVETF